MNAGRNSEGHNHKKMGEFVVHQAERSIIDTDFLIGEVS